MRVLPGLLLTLAIGAATGLGLTAFTVGRGTGAGALHIGPWLASPKAGTTEADPYSRAIAARLGTLPIALADGLALVADRDSTGAVLDGRCTYLIAGPMPPARVWTLTATGPDFEPLVAASVRQGFTSYEIVRFGDRPVDILLAPEARAGNWLPSGGASAVKLVLRLYDTPIATTISPATPMPAVTKQGCP